MKKTIILYNRSPNSERVVQVKCGVEKESFETLVSKKLRPKQAVPYEIEIPDDSETALLIRVS